MAKRRNKNKAKRRFAGLDRKAQINGEIVEKMMKMGAKAQHGPDTDANSVDDPSTEVQVTENGILADSVEKSKTNEQGTTDTLQKKETKPRGRKPNKNKQKTQIVPEDDGNKADYVRPVTEEVLIYPTEMNGETCIEVKCGNNEALLFLAKLCLGSKGSCIHYSDKWLTPNEFQAVSGRETAKDWKRSIRHKGRSLKMLISKGLITVQSVSPKKSVEKSDGITAPKKSDGITAPKKSDGITAPKKSEEITALVKADEITAELPVEAKPPVEKQSSEPTHDETESVAGGNDITVEQKIIPDTKPMPKKRGRKPKKLRRKVGVTNDTRNTAKVEQKVIGVPKKLKKYVAKKADDTRTSSPITEQKSIAVKAEVKPTPAEDERTSTPPEDTRTDEERRLDEFVKSLRLTKTVAVPKSAPELSTIDKVKDIPESTEYEEPEMPVLQKEADILPSTHESDRMDITVNVDTFHSTVTPPPTPPGDKVFIERKTDDEKHMETFKSHLASPTNGLKLTINREKVKADTCDNIDILSKIAGGVNGEQNYTKAAIQSFLLQDALQSARKYKEKLKQNSQSLSPKPIIQVPKVNSKVFEYKKAEHAISHSIPSPPIQTKVEQDSQQSTHKQGHKHLHNKHEELSRRQIAEPTKQQTNDAVPNGMPSMDDMKHLTDMSFQDFLAVMSSIYGPLPFPVDTKDAAFAALQEMHRRHDMLRLLTQGQMDGSTSSLLYPMMTQQILLAMTQQLYSMSNIPGWLPSTKPSAVSSRLQTSELQKQHASHISEIQQRRTSQISEIQQRRTSQISEIQQRRTSQISEIQQRRGSQLHEIPQRRALQTHEIQHRRTAQSQDVHHRRTTKIPEHQHRRISQAAEIQQRRTSQTPDIQKDISVTKRKHAETVTDYALDLSVKRQRTDHVIDTKPAKSSNVCDVTGYDAPLDFSMKKANNSDHCRNTEIDNRTNAINGSSNLYRNVEYDRRTSSHTNVVPKSGLPVCTCGSSTDDDITTWSVERVCYFLRDLDGCAPYAKTFHDQGISGRLLPYLTTQHLTRTLGMKVGPALTLMQAVERKFRDRRVSSSSSPCRECRIHQPTAMPVQI